MSQETQEALGETADSFTSELVTGGDRELVRDALRDRMDGSIPMAVGSAPSRWRRWIVLGAAAGLLLVVLYGIRVRLSTPVSTTSPVLNPVPSIASATLQPNDPGIGTIHPVLIVNGENFIHVAIVQWNGSNRQTVFVNTTKLVAICANSDLPVASTAVDRLVVVNPAPRARAY